MTFGADPDPDQHQNVMDLQHCQLFDVLCVQDSEEITNIELADAFQQMWAKRRYNEIFFMIDTCQVILSFRYRSLSNTYF